MTDNIKSLVERANEAARRAPNAAFIRDLADAIEKQAALITALESENRELSEFVVAVGGFWGNSKSKLVGEGSLAEVINRAFSECADSAKDAERYRKWVGYSGFTKEHTDATLDAISINDHAAKENTNG